MKYFFNILFLFVFNNVWANHWIITYTSDAKYTLEAMKYATEHILHIPKNLISFQEESKACQEALEWAKVHMCFKGEEVLVLKSDKEFLEAISSLMDEKIDTILKDAQVSGFVKQNEIKEIKKELK